VRSVVCQGRTGKAVIEPAADKAAQARQAQGGLPARRWQEGAKQAGTACRRFIDLWDPITTVINRSQMRL
jgi:hypothetical protein